MPIGSQHARLMPSRSKLKKKVLRIEKGEKSDVDFAVAEERCRKDYVTRDGDPRPPDTAALGRLQG